MAANIPVDTTHLTNDYIVYLSSPTIGRYVTVNDIGTNPSFFSSNSIVITTTSGFSFFDGQPSEYIRTPGGSLTFVCTAYTWKLMNTIAYTTVGHAYLSNVSTVHAFPYGLVSTTGDLMIENTFAANSGIESSIAPTIQGIPAVNTGDMTSTVQGLGQTYFSSVAFMNASFTSTVQGLGSYGYISSTQLQSTVAGLGSSYISSTWLTSTFQGLGTLYTSTFSLTSTVAGLGQLYISTPSVISTVQGLGNTYMSTAQLTSNVAEVFVATTSNQQSTIKNLGFLYVSTNSLVSTILGLSNVNTGYISQDQYISTTVGLSCNLDYDTISTAKGLGSAGYISSTQLQSTVTSLVARNQSNLSSNLSSLGSLYISSPSLQSTIAGLGTAGYISLAQLTSTTSGITSGSTSNLVSTVQNLGNYYISTPSLVSTVVGLSNASTSNITSTIAGLGLNYISSASLQSTVAGLGTTGYISVSQLTSTTTGLCNLLPINTTPNTLGSIYISSLSLQSTVAGLGTFAYISNPHLISTTIGLSNMNSNNLISTTQGLGQTYFSISKSVTANTYLVTTLYQETPNPTFTATSLLGNVLYFTSLTNIYEIDTLTYTGGSPFAYSYTFTAIKGVAATPTGIYVTDLNTIKNQLGNVIVNTTNSVGFTNSTNASTATFSAPTGMIVDSSYSNLYVCDTGNNAIRRVQLSPLSVTTVATITNPSAICLDSLNTCAYVTTGGGFLYKVSLLYSNVTQIASGLSTPKSICLDVTNTFAYVTNTGVNTLVSVTLSNGTITVLAGSGSAGVLDGFGTSASFNSPMGISFNSNDNYLYNVDNGSGKVRKTTTQIYSSTISGLTTVRTAPSISKYNATITGGVNSNFLYSYVSEPFLTGAILWLDGADPNGNGIKPSIGTTVATWVDKSGNGNNAYNSGNPTYTTTGVQLGVGSSFYTNLSTNIPNQTVFIVFNTPSTANQVLVSGTNGAIESMLNSDTILSISTAYSSPIIVSTLAGTGTVGSNDGAASNAQFNQPNQICVDSTNTYMYVADTYGFKIRRITLSNGNVITIAGTGVRDYTDGPGVSARFGPIAGICIDSTSTYLYVSDSQFCKIRRISLTDGQYTVVGVAGSTQNTFIDGVGSNAGFYSPSQICIDSTNTYLYVTDSFNHSIRRISLTDGNYTVFTISGTGIAGVANGQIGGATYYYPWGICIDSTSTYVYVTDSQNHTIRKIDLMYSNEIQKLYLVTTISGNVDVYGQATRVSGSGDGTGTGAAFYNPNAICIESTNTYLYVGDTANNKIRRIRISDINVTTIAGTGTIGSNDGAGSTATFSGPSGIFAESGTTLYVGDTNNNKIRKMYITDLINSTSISSSSVPSLTNNVTVFDYTVSLGTANGVYGYINTSNLLNGTLSSLITTGTVGIGVHVSGGIYSKYFVGVISEVIIYNTILTTTQRQGVETYLQNKWINFIGSSTTSNLYLSNSTLYINSNIIATTITANTFSASSGSLSGPSWGYYFGDGTHVVSSSDRRLKEDIHPITHALEKVNALQAVYYRLSMDPSRRLIGYISQDTEDILPEIVRTDDSPEEWKSIQYTNLPALIIESVKELNDKYSLVKLHLSSLTSP